MIGTRPTSKRAAAEETRQVGESCWPRSQSWMDSEWTPGYNPNNLTAVAVLPEPIPRDGNRPIEISRKSKSGDGEAKDYGHREVTASPERESNHTEGAVKTAKGTSDSRGGSQTPRTGKEVNTYAR